MAMAGVAAVAGSSAVTAVTVCSASRSSTSGIRPTPLAFKKAASIRGVALRSESIRSNSNACGTGSVLRFEPLRASSSDETTTTSTEESKQFDELVTDLKAKWDAVENKSTVAIYAGGALVTLWFSSTIIGAVNSVPLLPKLLELVGLGYTGWFVYRYLLFKSSRKELVSDIEELKGKIAGATTTITGTEEK